MSTQGRLGGAKGACNFEEFRYIKTLSSLKGVVPGPCKIPRKRKLCFRLGLSVRLSAHLFILFDNSKTYGRILMKFSEYV